MQTVTLKIDEAISEKFFWLLNHFSSDEIKIVKPLESTASPQNIQAAKQLAELGGTEANLEAIPRRREI
ncbi:hypothetical protein [Candidatus Albibeggiatoa sp. nov. BB20]|uniref:hypothetical protein n=1 Tax=Candidatus Albibeggiatoa sp. nov. BB20 TaxID=3162723 RepID=UPI003365AB60